MVVILTDDPDVTIDVEPEYLEYSPVLRAHMERWLKNGSIVMEGIGISLLINYIEFLTGNDFKMEEEDEEFFDYMGHHNHLEYPLEYWKLKLKNRWIRDNFYKLRLCERDGGYYGLVKIPLVRDILSIGNISKSDLPTSMTIAGGAALYLSGYSDYFADIDIFPMNKEEGINLAERLNLYEITVATATAYIDNVVYKDGNTGIYYDTPKIVQLIKREYSCPAEIVHGFDIDPTGFILVMSDENNLYATEIALYTASRKMMWFDTEFTEERYYWRLSKYVYKQFELHIPFLTEDNVNIDKLKEMINTGTVEQPIRSTSMVGRENMYTRLLQALTIGGLRSLPTDLGTFLILTAIFRLHIGDATYTPAVKEYIDKVIGVTADRMIMFVNYEPLPHPSTINDWVVKKKILLREPYTSDLFIDGAVALRDVLERSPIYQDR